MGMLEAMDELTRLEDAFRLAETVHLLLQRTPVMAPSFQTEVVAFMRRMLERLADTRRVDLCLRFSIGSSHDNLHLCTDGPRHTGYVSHGIMLRRAADSDPSDSKP